MDEKATSIIDHIVKIREYIELLRENYIIDEVVEARLSNDLDEIEAVLNR